MLKVGGGQCRVGEELVREACRGVPLVKNKTVLLHEFSGFTKTTSSLKLDISKLPDSQDITSKIKIVYYCKYLLPIEQLLVKYV